MQFFQSVDKCLRIVTGGVLIFEAEQIGFIFGVAAEFLQSERSDLPGADGGGTAQVRERNREQVPGVLSADEASRMAGRNMRDFVGHQASEFRFAVDRHDQSLVDIKDAAGQGENSEVRRIDHLRGKHHLRVGIAGDFLAELC